LLISLNLAEDLLEVRKLVGMMRLNLILILVLTTLMNSELIAQDKSPRLIQLSGVVLSADSLERLPFAAVFDKTTRHGTVSDYYGYFSLVTRPGDTLIFQYLGYKPSTYIVPDSLSQFGYALIQLMEPDTLMSKPVRVYPWPSKEEFARAFIEMDPYEDDLRRAQRQLSGENLAALASRVSNDASLTYSWQRQQQQSQLYSRGQFPVNNLLNPVAWAQFIEAWKKGKLKRE
jgi:transposase-like protein